MAGFDDTESFRQSGKFCHISMIIFDKHDWDYQNDIRIPSQSYVCICICL